MRLTVLISEVYCWELDEVIHKLSGPAPYTRPLQEESGVILTLFSLGNQAMRRWVIFSLGFCADRLWNFLQASPYSRVVLLAYWPAS